MSLPSVTYTITHPRWGPRFGTVTVLPDTREIGVRCPSIPTRTAQTQLRAVIQFLESAEYVREMSVRIHNIGEVRIQR